MTTCSNHVCADNVFDNLGASPDGGVWWNGTPEVRSAQPFVLRDNDTVTSVTVEIGGRGQPNGNLYVEIWDDSGSGTPGESVGQVGMIDALSVARETNGGGGQYVFASPVSALTPNEPYYVVVSTDGTNWSRANRISWGLTTTSGGRRRGEKNPGEAIALEPPTVAEWHTIQNFPTGGPPFRVYHFTSIDAIKSLFGDFDFDGALHAVDIDLLSKSLRDGSTDAVFDLNGDGALNDLDRTYWVEDLAGSFFGDADLDGSVQFSDFLSLSSNFDQQGGWAEGDFDGSGHVEFADFLLLSAKFGQSNQALAAVPEPSTAFLGVMGIGSLVLSTQRRRRNVIVRHYA